LEEATRSTQYAASIQPFQRTKKGRGAWLALKGQYAGNDKWEAEIKRQEQLLHSRIWKGQSNFSLEQFITQHRNAFVSLQACAEHVQHQLPNEHSRVSLLLAGIQNLDAALQAAMAAIQSDDGPNGKRNNFEAAATYLLPACPVAKKRQANPHKRGVAQISATDTDIDQNFQQLTIGDTKGGKPAIGKTGVHLRYHTNTEYKKLSVEQQNELREWRKEKYPDGPPTKKQRRGGGKQPAAKSYSKKQLSLMVAEQVKAQLKEKSEEGKGEEYILSLFNKFSNAQVSAAQATPNASSTMDPTTDGPKLNSIMKRVKWMSQKK
jgi:hypothetical protein